jgi:hypothetical protein
VQSAWWSAGEVSIGPFGSRSCFSGECRESGLSRFGGADLWMRSATATRAAGYIAMFVLLMFAGALAAKREPKLLARGSISAILTAGVVGAYFAAAAPTITGVSMSYGVFLYAGAVISGVAAIVLFLRRRS